MSASFHINDKSALFLGEKQSAITLALESIAMQAEGYAKTELENNPRRIDTGRLRNSIAHTTRERTAYIGTNVEYAIYVHEGFRRGNKDIAPNRFLTNAVLKHVDEYRNIVLHVLQSTW